MINICKKYHVEPSCAGWVIHESTGINKKTGKEKFHDSYHSTIQQVVAAVLDREAKKCADAAELQRLLVNTHQILVNKVVRVLEEGV